MAIHVEERLRRYRAREARKLARGAEQQAAPFVDPAKDQTLAEAFGDWRDETDVALSTQRTYALTMRYLAGAGILRLSDCTVANVRAYVKSLEARGLVSDSISHQVAALVSVLRVAVVAERFPIDVFDRIRLLKPKRRRNVRGHGQARFLTRDEVERLAVAARKIAPRLELPIRVAALTGCRVGELAKLRWSDFDLGDEPFLRIVQSPEHGERGSCKTGARTIPVCAELKALLLDEAAKPGRDPVWLFPCAKRKSGRKPQAPFLSKWSLEYELQFVRRAADLPEDIVFTTLRHSRISWWIQAGVAPIKVAAWAGHQLRVMMKNYLGLLAYDPDCERAPGREGGAP